MSKKRKALLVVLAAIGALAAVFFIYTADYYHADETARAAFEAGDITEDGDLLIMEPDDPNGSGLIFYPGGKVEAISYIPLLEKLREKGITCVLVEMPFNLAVFNSNAADGVYGKLPDVENWYIGGHSLGGAMASSYASGYMDALSGVVLLGAYIYGDVSPERTLTMYGSEDGVLDRSKIDYTKNVVVIDGGNHAQFGNYGKQDGDGEAFISTDEQQAVAVQAIADFMQVKQ